MAWRACIVLVVLFGAGCAAPSSGPAPTPAAPAPHALVEPRDDIAVGLPNANPFIK